MTSMFVELQTPLNEFVVLVCRGCLAESGEMKNINEWGLTDDFCKVTNVVLNSKEGISELLCTSCEDNLMACKRFISQCQESDVTLRNIVKAKEDAQPAPTNSIKFTNSQNDLSFSILAPNTESKIYLPCPYKCKHTYIKKKDLLTHIIKNHSIKKDYIINLHYYCHIKNCKFNKKYFTSRKNLNQHVNKVHKERVFSCEKCKSSFSIISDYNRHMKTCDFKYKCDICNISYNLNERLLVHLKRHHPEIHKEFKENNKAERKRKANVPNKKPKVDYFCDSPKRSSSTQTLDIDNIKNDVSLYIKDLKTDEISTQTVFEDLLSLKSHEDDSLFMETVSLSDIQTQTFPFEISRSNKETLTDLEIKENQTQTCVCDSVKSNFKLFDNFSSSNVSNCISTETQTQDNFDFNDLLSFNSAETQTCFDDDIQNCL